MEKTSRELAELLKGTLYGKDDVVITDVRSAESATPSDVTFARGIYAEHIEEMQAGVILVDELPKEYTKNLIVVEDCRRAFGELVALYHPEVKYEPGIAATAAIDKEAVIGDGVCIMDYCVVQAGAVIGDGTVLYPYVFVGKNAVLGRDCEINPGAVIHENSSLGDRVVLRAHAVIGGQGFGFSTDKKGHHTHIRQLGRAVLEDDVEVGAGSAVDNGAMNDTIVHKGTKIDNLVHLGHNVEVGEDCFIIAQTGIAGSTKVGSHCILAGQTGVNGHIEIADHVTLGGKSGVVGSIKEAGVYMGYPARTHAQWGRTEVLISHLPELSKRIRRLEKLLADKESGK